MPSQVAAALSQAAEGEVQAAAEQLPKDPGAKFSGKKSKAAAKQGTAKRQWEILRDSGIPESEIAAFRCGQQHPEMQDCCRMNLAMLAVVHLSVYYHQQSVYTSMWVMAVACKHSQPETAALCKHKNSFECQPALTHTFLRLALQP